MAKTITLKAKVETNADQAARAMRAFAGVVATADHGLRLAEKGARVLAAGFAETIGQTIGQSLKFRSSQDEGKRSIEAFNKSLLLTKVAIGDTLLPSVSVVTGAVHGVSDAFREWLMASNGLKQAALVEWAGDLSRILLSGVATAALLVTDSFYGILDGANAIKAGVIELAIASASRGLDEMPPKVRAWIDEVTGLNDIYAEGLNIQERSAVAHAALDKSIALTAEIIAASELRAKNQIGNTTDAMRVQTEAELKLAELRKRHDAESERLDVRKAAAYLAMHNARKAFSEDEAVGRLRELEADRQKDGDARSRRAREMTEDQRAAAMQQQHSRDREERERGLAKLYAANALSMINGLIATAEAADNVGDAFLNIAKSLAEIILQKLALAGLEALFGLLTAGGGGIATGLAGVLFGNTGTVVPRYAMGGAPSGFGWDSVPAMLTPGEVVVSAPAVRQAQSGITPRGLAPTSSPGNVTFNVSLNSSLPSTPAQTEDQLHRTIGPFLARHYGLRRR